MPTTSVVGATLGLTVLTALLAVGLPSPISPAPVWTHLAVSPGIVGAPGDVVRPASVCAYSSLAWHCSLNLTETARSNGNATWTTSSTGQATFSPNHGTLTPGSSVPVAVVISSCGGTYLLNFTGPQNTAQATFACG